MDNGGQCDVILKMERNLEHSPYTSVRKLFYNYPNKLSQPKYVTNSEENAPRFMHCLSDSKFAVQDNRVFLEDKPITNDRFLFKPISKSILFHGSYSDFYCEEAPKMKSNLRKTSWLSRSENKLSDRFFNRFNTRVRSFDPVKCRNLQQMFLKSFGETCTEYEIYDDTDSCYKCLVDDDQNEDDAEEIQGELYYCNSYHCQRAVERKVLNPSLIRL